MKFTKPKSPIKPQHNPRPFRPSTPIPIPNNKNKVLDLKDVILNDVDDSYIRPPSTPSSQKEENSEIDNEDSIIPTPEPEVEPNLEPVYNSKIILKILHDFVKKMKNFLYIRFCLY